MKAEHTALNQTATLPTELRLTVNGSLIRSQVSRVYAEVLDAAEEWQQAMREEG